MVNLKKRLNIHNYHNKERELDHSFITLTTNITKLSVFLL